jgi:NAD(P)-dependent dehydrogenase (short-subunit alcohol dehydrogenase family)
MVDDSLDFSGKVALVTGGSTGIGRAAALAFAKHGAKVVVGDINDAGAETVELLTRGGGEGLFVRTNVADAGEVQGLVERAVNAFGGLHCAFNNAGILPPTLPLAEQEVDVFDRVVAINVRGVFLCLKQELRHMVRAGGGAIVNTASIAGLIADPGMSPYVAAKHAVIGLTKSAAIDYAKSGIRVNALAPGLVRTPMTERWLADPAMREAVLSGPLTGRAAEPEEMVGTVLYLCSPMSSFATGQTFTIDGGQTAH